MGTVNNRFGELSKSFVGYFLAHTIIQRFAFNPPPPILKGAIYPLYAMYSPRGSIINGVSEAKVSGQQGATKVIQNNGIKVVLLQ